MGRGQEIVICYPPRSLFKVGKLSHRKVLRVLSGFPCRCHESNNLTRDMEFVSQADARFAFFGIVARRKDVRLIVDSLFIMMRAIRGARPSWGLRWMGSGTERT